jgi:hypothetical protein
MTKICKDYQTFPIYVNDKLSPTDAVLFILIVLGILMVEIVGIYLLVAMLDGKN